MLGFVARNLLQTMVQVGLETWEYPLKMDKAQGENEDRPEDLQRYQTQIDRSRAVLCNVDVQHQNVTQYAWQISGRRSPDSVNEPSIQFFLRDGERRGGNRFGHGSPRPDVGDLPCPSRGCPEMALPWLATVK